MEALTLKKRKNTVTKSKMKKTIKNILCRPDRITWPTATSEQCTIIAEILGKYKVDVPDFKKPHWSVLKDIPKADRPKAPKVRNVDGLIFGISHCARSISSGVCVAVLLDNKIEPKILVQHIIESCETANIPFTCVDNLKKITSTNFGISTCCLGVRKNSIEELLVEMRKWIPSKDIKTVDVHEIPQDVEVNYSDRTEKANIEASSENEIPFSYLYRTSKGTRAFIPHSVEGEKQQSKKFSGQEFIEVTNEVKDLSKGHFYKKMYVKRVTNNQNRLKKR